MGTSCAAVRIRSLAGAARARAMEAVFTRTWTAFAMKIRADITSRDRVLFPEAAITKGDLADYCLTIAEVILPWTAERPVSLIRCPQGARRSASSRSTMREVLATRSSTSPIVKRMDRASLICSSRMPMVF
jgi:hypothetical protein